MVLERVDLAQGLVLPSSSPVLQLQEGAQVLVLAQVSSTAPDEALPEGRVIVQDAQGQPVADVPLVPPEGRLLGAVSDIPSFLRSYSAVVPGAQVVRGMRLQVQVGTDQRRSLAPRVGPGHPITLVSVPIRFGAKVGQPLASMDSIVTARMPVASVQLRAHAEYTSQRMPTLPDHDWDGPDKQQVLIDLGELRTLEGAPPGTHYVGSLPAVVNGGGGIATRPGSTLLLVNTGAPAEDGYHASILLHELGHNFGLMHAACAGEDQVDVDFPYPQAALGKPGHYVWPYRADTRSFIDPRDNTLHDLMSYCSGLAAFSDYNYLKMQAFLDGESPNAPALDVATIAPGRMLLVSGSIDGDVASLRPLKRFEGPAQPRRAGVMELRLTTATGEQVYRFEPEGVADSATGTALFNLTVPDPGAVERIRVMRGSRVLLDRSNPQALRAAAAPSVAPDTIPGLSLLERAGRLSVAWDASRFRYLSVVHVGAARTVLALDRVGGTVDLPVGALPAGGRFELIVSDGLETLSLQRPR